MTDASWIDAMKVEIHALKNNNTWEKYSLLQDKEAIRCRQIYKVKTKNDGSLERFKARLVVKVIHNNKK